MQRSTTVHDTRGIVYSKHVIDNIQDVSNCRTVQTVNTVTTYVHYTIQVGLIYSKYMRNYAKDILLNRYIHMLSDAKFQLSFIFVGCMVWHLVKYYVEHPSVD
jgi:hypothetical protein